MSKVEKKSDQTPEVSEANHNASSYSCIKLPHVTEKSYKLFQNNKYTFLIYTDVNKIQVKEAIEGLYKVKVASVRVSNMKPKTTFVKGKKGVTSGFKKAIVTLEEGYTINI